MNDGITKLMDVEHCQLCEKMIYTVPNGNFCSDCCKKEIDGLNKNDKRI